MHRYSSVMLDSRHLANRGWITSTLSPTKRIETLSCPAALRTAILETTTLFLALLCLVRITKMLRILLGNDRSSTSNWKCFVGEACGCKIVKTFNGTFNCINWGNTLRRAFTCCFPNHFPNFLGVTGCLTDTVCIVLLFSSFSVPSHRYCEYSCIGVRNVR